MKVNELKYWLSNKETIFSDFDSFTLDSNDPNKRRIFMDRGSLILFVVHIDTIQKPKYVRKRSTKSGKLKRIYAQGLDDRLGCMIAFQLSEELGTDLLICDNEEKCRSTGQFHELKDYNWIVEFDREGKDVVTYDLDCDGFRKALSEHWEIGFGSYSDILQLQTQACCMNVGLGHHFSHSKDSYVDVKVMHKQIAKFKQFYKEYKDVKFERDYHTEYDYERYSEQYYADKWGVCELCGKIGNATTVYTYTICEDCFESMIFQYLFADETASEEASQYGDQRTGKY